MIDSTFEVKFGLRCREVLQMEGKLEFAVFVIPTPDKDDSVPDLINMNVLFWSCKLGRA